MSMFGQKCERCHKNPMMLRDDVLFPGVICSSCQRLIKVARLAGGKLWQAVANSTKSREELLQDFVKQLQEVKNSGAQNAAQRRAEAQELDEIIMILNGL